MGFLLLFWGGALVLLVQVSRDRARTRQWMAEKDAAQARITARLDELLEIERRLNEPAHSDGPFRTSSPSCPTCGALRRASGDGGGR